MKPVIVHIYNHDRSYSESSHLDVLFPSMPRVGEIIYFSKEQIKKLYKGIKSNELHYYDILEDNYAEVLTVSYWDCDGIMTSHIEVGNLK